MDRPLFLPEGRCGELTFAFCDRFIHLYKDRTRDQMIQAARTGYRQQQEIKELKERLKGLEK